jgi:uncharacterized protein YwlG (UPF0340 family)
MHSLGPAKNFDALHLTSAGIIGDIKVGLHLYHINIPLS